MSFQMRCLIYSEYKIESQTIQNKKRNSDNLFIPILTSRKWMLFFKKTPKNITTNEKRKRNVCRFIKNAVLDVMHA